MKNIKFFLTLLFATLFVSSIFGAIADGTYVLCTSESDLVAGNHYIIASMTSGSGYCVSNVSNSNNRKTVTATSTSSEITVETTSTIMTFTLGGSTGTWTFYTDNYAGTAGYLAATSSSKNYVGIVASPGTEGNWAVTFSGSVASMITQGTYTHKTLQYNYNNGTTPIFSCYTSANQSAVYLYKLSNACTNTINFTKGTATDGTIALDKTSACIDGGNASVVVTATPNAHYSFTGVNVNGGGSPSVGTISGNQCTVSNLSADATLTPVFTEDAKYTVTFNMNGHGTNTSESVYTGEKVTRPTDPTASGWAFKGWYTEAGCTNEFDFNTAITAAKTLYAKWVAAYNVTINSATGGNVTTSATAAEAGSNITLTITPNTGYELSSLVVGGSDVTSKVSSNKYTFSIASNVMVSATFTQIEYTITIQANNGTITSPATSPITKHYGESVTIEVSANEGYTFNQWQLSGSGSITSTTSYSTTYTVGAGNATITASCVLPGSISFHVPGCCSSIDPIKYTSGVSFTMPALEAIEGYTAVGWVKSTYATATSTKPTDIATADHDTTITGSASIDYYALYSVKEETCTGKSGWWIWPSDSALKSGDEYVVIGLKGTSSYYYMSSSAADATTNGLPGAISTTVTNGQLTSVNAAMKWVIKDTVLYSKTYYLIKSVNTKKSLYPSNQTGTSSLNFQGTGTQYSVRSAWKITAADQLWRIQSQYYSDSTAGGFLATQTTGTPTDFRLYKATAYSITTSLYLFKQYEKQICAETTFYTTSPKCLTKPTITFNDKIISASETVDLSTLFTSNSDGAVTFTCSANPSLVSGTTFGPAGVGTYTITATQTKTDSYSAGTATAKITVTSNFVAVEPCPVGTTTATAQWSTANCGSTATVSVYTKTTTNVGTYKMPSITGYVEGMSGWSSGLSASKWAYYMASGTYATGNNSSTYGICLTKSSYNACVVTPQMGALKSGVDESTEYEVTITAYHANSNHSIKCIVVDGDKVSDPRTNQVSAVVFDGATTSSWDSGTADWDLGASKTFTFTVKGITSTSRLVFSKGSSTSTVKELYLTSISIKTNSRNVVQTVSNVTCSTASANVTGLTAGTQYYYTVTSNGVESNEIAFKTWTSTTPSLTFSPATAALHAEVGSTAQTVVSVSGYNFASNPITSLTGLSAPLSVVSNTLVWDCSTGEVTGDITIQYTPTTSGNVSQTLTLGDTYTLPVTAQSCASQEVTVTNINEGDATINITSAETGTVYLYDLGNPYNNKITTDASMETANTWNGTGWGATTGNTTSASVYHTASPSLHFDQTSTSSYKRGDDGYYTLFHTPINTLPAGTYTLTMWVRGEDQYSSNVPVFCGVTNGGTASGTNITYGTSDVVMISGTTWTKLTCQYTVASTYNAYVFVARRSKSNTEIYVDDAILTVVAAGEPTTYTLNNAKTLTIEDELAPNHNYYVMVQNNSGCSWESAEFNAGAWGAAPSLSATPNPLEFSCAVSNKQSKVLTVTGKYLENNIAIEISGTDADRFTVSSTTMAATGGSLPVVFTSQASDVPGSSYTATLKLTSDTYTTTITLKATIAAGIDPATPMVEVVEVDTTMLAIEHNITGVDNVEIVINRQMTSDEIDENVGLELFFSKYYEAYQNVKLWAVYNPTPDSISLVDTYVFLGANNNPWHKTAYSPLDGKGKYNPHKIAPNEEIIVYCPGNSNADNQTITCASDKADMSDWNCVSASEATAFSGDDALGLVRGPLNDRYGKTDYVDSKTGSPVTLTWHRYSNQLDRDSLTGARDYEFIDLIGAVTESTYNPTTTNAKQTPVFYTYTGSPLVQDKYIGSGDAAGWIKIGKNLAGVDATLSTNRCLLIRSKEVKSGSTAVNTNIGDMYTLQYEWMGSYVPVATAQADMIASACENFAFVGGYDYANYYSAYVPIDGEAYTFVCDEEDSVYYARDFETLRKYTCQTLLIQCVKYTDVNGTQVREVKTETEYKVPIIVNKVTTTNDKNLFPTSPAEFRSDTCPVCDVVIRPQAKLTDVTNGQHKFRNVQVYVHGRLDVPSGQTLDIENLEMRATNDTVAYAIVDGNLKVSGSIAHTKRMNADAYYNFSLPYDCKISEIRQYNGKSLGTYGKDWFIYEYDGASRAENGTWNEAGTGYNNAHYWVQVASSATLKAHTAYSIGLGGTSVRYKSIYFPPTTDSYKNVTYTESGTDSKSLTVTPYNGAASNRGATDSKYYNDKGWNFIGHPYISLFNHSLSGSTGTNNDKVKMGFWTGNDYTSTDKVYVNIPTGGFSAYTQAEASSLQMMPFLGYFVQVAGSADATLTFEKTARVLPSNAPMARSINSPDEHAEVSIKLTSPSKSEDETTILVDEVYSDEYEVARDLVKLARPAGATRLYSFTPERELMLRYNAIPAATAQNIALGYYAGETGEYTIAIDSLASNLSAVTAVMLRVNGIEVANLLNGPYKLSIGKAKITDDVTLSIGIQRLAQVTVGTSQILEGVNISPVVYTRGNEIEIIQLPESGNLKIMDVVGRVIVEQELNGQSSLKFDIPVSGVYTILIDNGSTNSCLKTVIK